MLRRFCLRARHPLPMAGFEPAASTSDTGVALCQLSYTGAGHRARRGCFAALKRRTPPPEATEGVRRQGGSGSQLPARTHQIGNGAGVSPVRWGECSMERTASPYRGMLDN